MIEFGKTLRTAREARGLSVRQLAELTRMAPTTVQELESENFERIAAPIYGRGFVKLYCEAVGLEAKPLILEFMELYNGTRDAEIKERVVPGTAESAVCPPAEDAAEPPAEPAEDPSEGEILEEPPIRKSPFSSPIPSAPQPAPEPDLFHQAAEPARSTLPESPQEPKYSRYASPVRSPAPSSLDSRAFLRLGLLATVFLAVLAVLFMGIRAVYRATTPKPDTEPAAEEVVQTPETPAVTPEKAPTVSPKRDSEPLPAPAKTKRTPQEIPSLYID